jgi:hypothetical protein
MSDGNNTCSVEDIPMESHAIVQGNYNDTNKSCESAEAPPKQTYTESLFAGANIFAAHNGTGLGFGLAEQRNVYDRALWERVMGGKPPRPVGIRAKKPASEAFAQLMDDITNNRQTPNGPYWSMDCMEFTQLLRIYGYWQTLSADEFDARFPSLAFGATAKIKIGWRKEIWFESSQPGELPFAGKGKVKDQGIVEPDGGVQLNEKTWDDLLTVVPIGTHIQWTNLALEKKCIGSHANADECNWTNEHSTKVAQDQFAAWDLGVVSTDELMEKMAEISLGSKQVTEDYLNENIYIKRLDLPEQLSEDQIQHLLNEKDPIWQQAPIPID